MAVNIFHTKEGMSPYFQAKDSILGTRNDPIRFKSQEKASYIDLV